MTGLPDMPAWAAPAFAIPGTYEQLDCGCETWCQVNPALGPGPGNTFMIHPCSLTCENYLWALAESQKQGNTLEYRRYG